MSEGSEGFLYISMLAFLIKKFEEISVEIRRSATWSWFFKSFKNEVDVGGRNESDVICYAKDR